MKDIKMHRIPERKEKEKPTHRLIQKCKNTKNKEKIVKTFVKKEKITQRNKNQFAIRFSNSKTVYY